MTDAELRLIDRSDDQRYELRRGADVISLATYRRDDGVVTIPHVETSPEHRGNGYADALMSAIVDDVRASGLRIRAICPFAAAFMRNDAAHHDLIAD